MRRLAMVALALLAAGCGPEQRSPTSAAGADTTWMALEWAVAPGAHPAADSLGLVSGVTLDANEDVYVADRLAAKIWVFGADGDLRGAVGRKGEGPGEFEAPTGASVGPDGLLYVRDVFRVTVFGRDEASGMLGRVETTFDGPVYADWTSTRATRFDSTGAMLYPGSRWEENGIATPYVLRFESGEPADSVFVPTYANAPQLTAHYRTGPSGGRMLLGLNHVPFAPLPVWDVSAASTVVSGDGRSYELVVTDFDGMVVDTLRRPHEPETIPSGERDDSIAALRARIDSIPVPLDQVEGMPESVRGLDVPDTYPAYRAVYASVEGDIWVRRWTTGATSRSIFDVFSNGAYERTVVLPRWVQDEPTPYLSRSVVIAVATDPLTDEYIVMRFAPTDTP